MPPSYVSPTFHVTYAAIVVGLLTTALLCPIVCRTSELGGELCIFGVRLSYTVPEAAEGGGPDSRTEVLTSTHVDMSLSEMPASMNLHNCLVAYLVSAVIAILLSFGLMLIRMLQLCPQVKSALSSYVTHIFLLGTTLSTLVCMSVAAVVVTSPRLHKEIANGYFSGAGNAADKITDGVHSGFSCLVAAAILSVISIVTTPLIPWKQ